MTATGPIHDPAQPRSTMRRNKRSAALGAAAATVAVGALLVTSATSQAAGGNSDHIGNPKFEDQPSATGVVSKDAITIPNFTSTFTDPSNGKTYHYTMVGTDPTKGDVSTTIPTMIIPMDFTFEATGATLNGSDKVTQTRQSPVFQNADIGAAANNSASAPPGPPISAPGRTVNEPSDRTQVGDAIYRAQFHKTGT